MTPFIIGTRGSPLALAQTRMIQTDLQRRWPEETFELKIIKTTGDTWAAQPQRTEPLGKGLFTKELEEALLRGEIDLALHSLKDLPVEDPPGLSLVAIPPRVDPRDLLITRREVTLSELPHAAVIATGSPRRRSQLARLRPDLQFVDLRGNIDTRLRKLRENSEWSAIVLAAAGLERLKPDCQGLLLSALSPEEMLPAPGQGALGLQMRVNHPHAHLVQALDDPITRTCVTAERSFLLALGGGCQWPIGALAFSNNSHLTLHGFLSTPNQPGSRITVDGTDPVALGKEAASKIKT